MSVQTKQFKRKLIALAVMAATAPLCASTLAQDTQLEEEVLVTGLRSSIMQSMDLKRNAGSVVDSITATDIGKLPDATIADSLQRIPGIQITRSGGEGAVVTIRGNGNLATTLNGEQMLAAGSITNIRPDFADIPATMVNGLDVYKSAEAKHLTAGLSGTINLRTARPFELKDGLTTAARVEITNGSLGGEYDPAFAGFVAWNNERLGAMVNLSKSTSYLADYNNGAQGAETGEYGGWSFNATEASSFLVDDLDVNGDGDTNDVYYAFQGHQAGNRFIDRDRTGVNTSFQFAVNDNLELTLDTFYTKMEEHHYFAGFVASQGWQGETGWFTPDPGGLTEYPNITHPDDVLTENEGNYYTVQSAQYQARAIKTHTQTWAVNKEALNTNLQLDFEFGAISGSARWVHGEGSSDDVRSVVDAHLDSGLQRGGQYQAVGEDPVNSNPWGYDGVPATLPDGSRVPQLDDDGNQVVDDDGNPVWADPYYVIPVGVSYSGGKQNWSLPTLDVTEQDGSVTSEVLGSNLARYSAKSTNLYGEYTNATLDAMRIDAAWAFDDAGPLASVDFGARYGIREVSKQGWIGGVARTNQHGDAFIARWKDTATRAPYRDGETPPGGVAESYIEPVSFAELDDLGMIKSESDFHGTTGLGTLYFIDPEAMKDPVAWHEQVYGTNVLAPDAANVYTVEETTASAYVQANLDGEIGGLHYRGNLGLRYVQTEFDVDQSDAHVGGSAEFNGTEYLLGPGMVAPVGAVLNTKNSYSDLLPAINLALDLTDEQLLRFSYTKTVSTHDTDMLGGGLTVNRVANCNLVSNGATVFCATGGGQEGNPELEPNRNTNADLSYEWYFGDSSMFSAGLFWVQSTTGFESVVIQRDDIPDSDGVVRGYDLETQEFRGYVEIQTTQTVDESGETYGMELGYRQSFDFLEGFWNGFGIDANFTYSPSDGSTHDYYGEEDPAGFNSEYQTNFAVWYEAHGWQARVAHNYRSEMFVSRKLEGNYHFGYWVAPTNYIDASLSYEFNDWGKVLLQATNLTEEYIETYHQWENNIDGRFYNERRLTLGFQVKL